MRDKTLDELDGQADSLLSHDHYAQALSILDDMIAIEAKGPNHPQFLLSICLRKAHALLELDRPKDAYRFLIEDTPKLSQERHAYEKRYWNLLAEAGESTGHGAEARDARASAQELALDWGASLERAGELRLAGRDEESLAFYERSIRMNPGELGTAAALENAVFGKARALLSLGRKDDAKRLLLKTWINANSKEYQALLAECG